jgi:hypothetical protein
MGQPNQVSYFLKRQVPKLQKKKKGLCVQDAVDEANVVIGKE